MGTIQQLETNTTKLDFYIEIKDRNLGNIKVYKKIDKKLRYIVKY
jgi:hypothetical protein